MFGPVFMEFPSFGIKNAAIVIQRGKYKHNTKLKYKVKRQMGDSCDLLHVSSISTDKACMLETHPL